MSTADPNELRRRMTGALDVLKKELSGLRTGRASASLLEPVQVDAYGSHMPISQVGTVSVPEPRMLTVSVWDRGLVKAVEKGIREANLGLNPMTEGQTIRVPIPPLTEERRKEYVKLVKQKAEEARVAVRNIRRDELHRLERMQKDGEIAEDAVRRAGSDLQRITDHHVHQIDGVASRKEADVMEV